MTDSLDPLTILKIVAILGAAFFFVGIFSLFVGAHKARRAFRSKGFLRPPSGVGWLRFLFLRQYEWFENPGIRLYFGTSHICVIGVLVALGAMIVLVGSEFMLNGMNGFTLGGPGAPTIPLPQ